MSKAKRVRKGIINDNQWRSDEIMQSISMGEQQEALDNVVSPDFQTVKKGQKL